MTRGAKPRPTKLRTALRGDADITLIRNVHCPHYAGCIDVVVKKDWPSFTCASCPFFREAAEPHASEHAYDQPRDKGLVY